MTSSRSAISVGLIKLYDETTTPEAIENLKKAMELMTDDQKAIREATGRMIRESMTALAAAPEAAKTIHRNYSVETLIDMEYAAKESLRTIPIFTVMYGEETAKAVEEGLKLQAKICSEIQDERTQLPLTDEDFD